jgi:hypothetical protein
MKPVLCIETKKEYPSQKDAAKAMGVHFSVISAACRKGTLAAGYHWKKVSDDAGQDETQWKSPSKLRTIAHPRTKPAAKQIQSTSITPAAAPVPAAPLSSPISLILNSLFSADRSLAFESINVSVVSGGKKLSLSIKDFNFSFEQVEESVL